MSDELTPAPYVDGAYYVYPSHGGLRLPRVWGGDGTEEVEDTPVEDAAPVDGTPAADAEYTPERARGLHAELTKAQQELADVRHQKELWGRAQQGDLDAMRELQLPVQFEDELEEEEDDSPRDPRLDTLLAEREQEKQQREAAENWTRFTTDLDKLAKEKGKTLSDRERFMVYTETLNAGGTPDALANVFGEYIKERAAADKAAVEAFIESKKNAPFISPGGTGANEVTDPLDGKARRERLASRLDASEF